MAARTATPPTVPPAMAPTGVDFFAGVAVVGTGAGGLLDAESFEDAVPLEESEDSVGNGVPEVGTPVVVRVTVN